MNKELYPHPACMAPDGADPCESYHAALDRIAELEAELSGAQQGHREILDMGIGKCLWDAQDVSRKLIPPQAEQEASSDEIQD